MGTSRERTRVLIYIDGRVNYDAELVTCRESVGSANSDEIQFDIVDRLSEDRIGLEQNEVLDPLTNNSASAVRRTRNGPWRWIHHGKVVKAQYISDRIIRYTSRLDRHLYGVPWVMQDTISWPRLETVFIDKIPVMNPFVDGNAIPNMVRLPFSSAAVVRPAGLPTRSFIEPDSLPFQTLHKFGPAEAKAGRIAIPGLAVDFWTLPEAVDHICKTVNQKEYYVRNPTDRNLIEVLSTDRDIIRDFQVPRGAYLPEILDALLLPYGYHWWVEKQAFINQIFIGKRGTTPRVGATIKKLRLPLQESGESADNTLSTVKRINVRADLVERAANRVLIMGDYEKVEATVELIPAWEPTLDLTPLEDIRLGSEAIERDPRKERVWRDWVMNEGGDYTLIRTETDLDNAAIEGADYRKRFLSSFDYGQLFDFKVFEQVTEKGRKKLKPKRMNEMRRRLHPTISLNSHGTPIGPYQGIDVEYSLDEGTTWKPFAELGDGPTVQPLTNECGIRIQHGPDTCEALRSAGLTHLRIRVTATFISDWRIKYIAPSSAAGLRAVSVRSKLDDELYSVVDNPSFQYRHVLDKGEYSSRWTAARAVADEATDGVRVFGGNTETDDRAAMAKLGELLVDSWSLANVGGTITLEGLDYNHTLIGSVFEGIDGGRDIVFRSSGLKTDRMYPDVVGVDYDVAAQETHITLDSYRRR